MNSSASASCFRESLFGKGSKFTQIRCLTPKLQMAVSPCHQLAESIPGWNSSIGFVYAKGQWQALASGWVHWGQGSGDNGDRFAFFGDPVWGGWEPRAKRWLDMRYTAYMRFVELLQTFQMLTRIPDFSLTLFSHSTMWSYVISSAHVGTVFLKIVECIASVKFVPKCHMFYGWDKG